MRKLTPIKAIRAKCLDCTAQQSQEVLKCNISDCPLWTYRLGTRDAEATLAKRRNRVLAKNT